jgi:hypothetical protein
VNLRQGYLLSTLIRFASEQVDRLAWPFDGPRPTKDEVLALASLDMVTASLASQLEDLADGIEDAWDCGYPTNDPNHNFYEFLRDARAALTEYRRLSSDDYPHLSGKQRAIIRNRAADIFAAGDGADDIPGRGGAVDWVSKQTIAQLLAWDREGIERKLDFDPETGEPWLGEAQGG